ncbi:MAG: UDP-glucose/GDP-mannose dehydrogenase family protein [Acidobacteriia bacterium]|nr:UDP-glucose/GDP-mannose dehydrogenase family protein [Terriglobia bacterium]
MADRRPKKVSAGKPKIAVLGMGHVGLPTALGLADLGLEVIGADSNAEAIAKLRTGICTFYEPGLQPLLTKHSRNKRFQLTEDVGAAISAATVLFICVGTPQKENGEADLTQVEGVARVIARNLNGYKLIVEKSTVPAITGQWIKRTIERFADTEAPVHRNGARNGSSRASTVRFEVASNPEFLQEGRAVEDFFRPDRIVIGVESERAQQLLESIYRPLKRPILVTDLNTAELIKHAANAFLSTKISFINMVSDVCEAVGADVVKVAQGIGMDSRIGSQFLKAGIGFGGSCFPKDVRAFIHLAETHGLDVSLMHEVESINRKRIDIFLKKLRKSLWVLRGKTLAVLGLAFKPLTDDIREAPALKIINALLEDGVSLRLYDPQAMAATRSVFPEQAGRVTYCESAYDAARGTHAVLVLTEWDEFRKLDLKRLHDAMEVPIMLDGRNLYDPSVAREHGFEYACMGRPTAGSAPAKVTARKQVASSRKPAVRGVLL